MLTPDLKEEIQQGYRQFLSKNSLSSRMGQKQMIAAIANALGEIEDNDEGYRVSNNGLCVIEAGTGTGKTIAYLLAALPIARSLGKRVVIATGTVALQEQLVNRDIPALLNHTEWDYSISLAKGRGRYLCPLRLEQCLNTANEKAGGAFLFDDEVSFKPTSHIITSYREMDASLKQKSWAGDRDSWPEAVDDVDWWPLTVDRRQCSGRRCRHIRECCFFNARDALDESDCIVANHDLVMADLALGGGVILPSPEETIYIFDEGHRIGTTALNHFSGQCRIKASVSWLAHIQKQIVGQLPLLVNTPDLAQRIEKIANTASSVEKLLSLSYPLFERLLDQANSEGQSYSGHQQGLGGDNVRWRFPSGDPGGEVRESAEHIADHLSALSSQLDALSKITAEAMDEPHFPLSRVDLEQLFQQVGIWLGRVDGTYQLWQSYAESEDSSLQTTPVSLKSGSPHARWLSLEQGVGGSTDILLSASPTDPGSILRGHLWQRCYAAVITSATLRTLGSFSSFQQRLGLPVHTKCETVMGAFDYARVGVLSVPDLGVDPGDAKLHTDMLIATLPRLINWDEGTLVLFSSRRQMDLVYENLPKECFEALLVQGQWGHQEILHRHKAAIDRGEGSTIFGLASFAEGVDLPGDYCRHVVITKIPFSVPDDPIYATISEWLVQRGGNSFMDLMLPDASLRLHQACGRLIRSETDTGKVTILDRRIITKRYGTQLLQDLPPFHREVG